MCGHGVAFEERSQISFPRVVALACAATFGLLLAACGASSDSATGSDAPSSTDRSTSSVAPSTSAQTSASTSIPPPSTAASTDPTPTSTPGQPDTDSSAPLPGRTIVVDPGHNGANYANSAKVNALVDAGGFSKACNTTGTAAGDYTEAQFNWELAQRLRDRLQALGATVVLTRQDNEGWGPCIDERGLTAARIGADALVSLHADGAGPASSGFHVIHPGPVPGFTDGIVEPSAQLARLSRDALVANGFRPADYIASEGLVQRTDLGTLNRAGVPVVMLEAGNMRNADDLAVLRSADGQERLAAAMSDALRDHLSPRG